jgi:hypothetical protein
MTHWMHPPRGERSRERDRFDPIAEGARYQLPPEVLQAIWDQACTAATDQAGHRNEPQARRQFHELAARRAERGKRSRPEVGKLTRAGTELDGHGHGATIIDELTPPVPGRTTLVDVEARRRAGRGESTEAADAGDGSAAGAEHASMTDGAAHADDTTRAGDAMPPRASSAYDRWTFGSAPTRLELPTPAAVGGAADGPSARRELPGAHDVAQAMAALLSSQGSYRSAHDGGGPNALGPGAALLGFTASQGFTASDHGTGLLARPSREVELEPNPAGLPAAVAPPKLAIVDGSAKVGPQVERFVDERRDALPGDPAGDAGGAGGKARRGADGTGLGLAIEATLDDRRHTGKLVVDPTLHLVDPKKAAAALTGLGEAPPAPGFVDERMAELGGGAGDQAGRGVAPPLKGLELRTKQSAGHDHEHDAHQAAKPLGPAAGGGHPMAAPALPKPKQPPKELLSTNQAALDGYIARCEAERAKAKDKVAQQKLAKSTAAQIDAKAIAARVKAANDAKLAKLRADAVHDKAATAQAEQTQKQEGQATIESLKAKLEDKLTADKQKLQTDFEQKKQELTLRLETQKETLKAESAKQIANLKTQQKARVDDANRRWEAEKAGFKQQAEDLMVQMRHQMEADKTKLADQQKQTMQLASDKAAGVEKDANDKAADLIKRGDTDAQAAINRATASGNQAQSQAQAQADKETDDTRKSQLLAGGVARRRDLITKGDLSATDIKTKAKEEAQKVRDAGAAQKKKVIDAAANQVKAIDDKINSLAGLAQKRVAENEAALQAKLKGGQDALDKTIGELQKTIDKKQQEADAKITKLDDDGAKRMQTDYDQAVKAIDQKANVARQALAHGTQKSIAQLEKLVDSTITSIDRSVTDTEKKFDATIASAERQATALVMATLQSIKAEADKLLVQIDKEYDAQIKAVQDAVVATHKQIDDTARGKMLEVEVHVATMFADLGQKDRLTAVKKQLEWYVKNHETPPKGFGETGGPPPPASDKKADPKAADQKTPAQEAADKAKADKAEADRRANLDPDERAKEDADKAKADAAAKDPAPAKKPGDKLSDTEVDAQVEALMKKGQTATVGAAQASATASVKAVYDDGRHAINHVVNQKMSEIENLERGGTDAQVEQFKVDQKAGQTAADQIATAANHEGFWGKSPDKKAIVRALEGKTPAQIEALRAALLAKTPPINIDDLITNTLSGDEQKEARIRMLGNPDAGDIQALLGAGGWKPSGNEKTGAVVAGAVIAGPVGAAAAGLLVDAASGAGVDHARIEEILKNHPDPAERARFAEAFERQTGQSFNDYLKQNAPDLAGTYSADKTPEAVALEKQQADLLKQAEADRKAGKIDPSHVGPAVDKLRDALDNFHVDGTRADLVAKALEGKTPAEIALIMAEFKRRPGGEDLQAKLRTMLSGPALVQAEATLKNDPEQIAVSKLMGAEQSSWTPWTVDDKKLQDTLEGLTDPEQRRRVLAMYKTQTGIDLTEVIEHKMSGNDRLLAACLAKGDTLGAATVKLNEASNGGWLNAMQDAAHDRFGIPKEVSKGITNVGLFGVGGSLLAQGNSATIDGYSVGDGNIHKVDSDQIFKVMESIKDPADRAKLAAMYKEATGKDLDADMKAKLGAADPLGSGAKYDAFQALMDGDYDKAAACQAKAALSDGVLQDKAAFYKQLEGKSEWERQRIMAAFNQQYGGGDPSAFRTFYANKLDGLDAEKANLLAQGKDDAATGVVKLPPAFELKYAMDSVWVKAAHAIDGGAKSADAFFAEHPMLRVAVGIATLGESEVMLGEAKAAAWMMSNWGVDDEKVLSVLREHPELAKNLDPQLKAEIQYTLSGRSLNEAQYYLDHGVPQTPEDKLKFQLAMYQFDRGGSNALSKGLTDLFSVSGKDYDAQYHELLGLQAQIEACKSAGLPVPPELLAEASWTAGMSSATGTQYDQDKSKVANAAATAVGVVVGAVVTALTGGVAGAILGALAAGLATIATKATILGDSYKKGELGVDVVMTLVNAMTAGVLKAEPFKAFCEGLKFLSTGGQQLLNAVIGGAGAAALSSMVQTMLTSKDAHDLLGLLGQGAKAGLWAAITGGANAAAMHALNGVLDSLATKLLGTNATDQMGQAFRKPGLVEAMLKGYVSGGGGAMASMAVEAMADPAVLSGSWDTVLANTMQRFHEGGFQNAMQSGADHYDQAHTVVIEEAVHAAKEAQAEGKSPEAQREAFAEKLAEGAQAEAAKAGHALDGSPIAELGGELKSPGAPADEHGGPHGATDEHGAPIKPDPIIAVGEPGAHDEHGAPIKPDPIIAVGEPGAHGATDEHAAPHAEDPSTAGRDKPLDAAQSRALDAALETNAHMATADEGSCNVTTHSLGERIATATGGEVLPEVHGVDHKFLKAGGAIIDPTFHQFFEGLPSGIEPEIFHGSKAELVGEINRLLATGDDVRFDGVAKSELTPEKINALVEKYWPDSAPNATGNPDQMYVLHGAKGDKYFYGDFEKLAPEVKAKCEPVTAAQAAEHGAGPGATNDASSGATSEAPSHGPDHVPGETPPAETGVAAHPELDPTRIGAVDATRTGAGSSSGAEGELVEVANKSHIVERAAAILDGLPPEQRAAFEKLVGEAENPAQKVMLERALAAGASAQDLPRLAEYMKGYSEAEIAKRFTGADTLQFFQESCVPATLQAARAQVDPLYAFKLVMDPVFAAQEQARALQETGGRTAERRDGVYDKKLDALLEQHPDLKAFLDDPKNFDRGSHGIEPTLMKGNDLLENLQHATGVTYEVLSREGMPWKDTGDGQFKIDALPHDRIQAALERGLPVPFSALGHEQLLTDCFTKEGKLYYVVHDPMSGNRSTIPAELFEQIPMLKPSTLMLPAEVAGKPGAPESGGSRPAAPPDTSSPTETGGRVSADEVKQQFATLNLGDADAAKLAGLSVEERKLAADRIAQGKSVDLAIKMATREVARTNQVEQAELEKQVAKNLAAFNAGTSSVTDPADRAFIDPTTDEGKRNFRRASDLDKSLGERTIEEARDMDHAEKTRQLEPPVERSTRPGADVVTGSGASEEHWSMKDIRDSMGPDQLSESTQRALKEITQLVNQRTNGGQTPGVIVSLRHVSPANRAAARAAIEAAAKAENGRLLGSSNPAANKAPLPVTFIE